jgi:hypothetical protein
MILDLEAATAGDLVAYDSPGKVAWVLKVAQSIRPKDRIVKVPTGCDRAEVLTFLRAQVGAKYGFLTILSILVTELSPKFVNVMLPNTWICSAVVAEGLRFGGWYHASGDIYQISPDELWCSLQ